jgi:hypothetical protein
VQPERSVVDTLVRPCYQPRKVLRRLASLALVYAVVVASTAAARRVDPPPGWNGGEWVVTHPAVRRMHRPAPRLPGSDGAAPLLVAILPPRIDLPPPASSAFARSFTAPSFPRSPAPAPPRARAPPVPA